MAKFGRIVSVLNIADNKIHTVNLPVEGASLVASPKGKVYIGSPIDGIMTLDVATLNLSPQVQQTGGGVLDLAGDPQGKKLWMAMGQHGLKSLTLSSGKVAQVSDRPCPIGVAVDHGGKRVYVAFQCGGPGGRKGHDAIEIFDANSEKSLGVMSGPPLVGNYLSVSSDDKLVATTAMDACIVSAYDHAGCPRVPGDIVYLLRTQDYRFVKAFDFPPDKLSTVLVGVNRLVVLGGSVNVFDASNYSLLERLDLGGASSSKALLSPDARRLWINLWNDNALLSFDLKESYNLNALPDPAISYPGDGSFEDAAGGQSLAPHGNVQFFPGRERAGIPP